MTPAVGRRRLLGYVGTAAAGAVVGASGGVVGAQALAGDRTLAPPPRSGALPSAISPHGVHQAGVAAHPSGVTELVALDLLPEVRRGRDREALARLLRVWTGDVEALAAGRGAPGDTAPWLAAVADLTVTVGLGPRVVTDAWGIPVPEGFATVPPMRHDRLRDEWSGGDLLLLVTAADPTTAGHAVRRLVADARPFASLRWRQQGAWRGRDEQGRPVTGRNLFGQVDGSANPRPGTDLFDTTVWIRDGAWAGGTTLVVRRIRMDLPTWDELTPAEQEASVGRDLAEGAPLTGGREVSDVDLTARRDGRWAIAEDAHARRTHHSTNGGRRIFRKGANYEVVGPAGSETGLLFQSFQRDLADQYVPIQQTMDRADALNEWTTAIGSAEFAILPGFAEGEWLGQGLLG